MDSGIHISDQNPNVSLTKKSRKAFLYIAHRVENQRKICVLKD